MTHSPAPVCLARQRPPIAGSGWQTTGIVELTLFDFGAVSVVTRVPFDTDLDGLAALSGSLDASPLILDDARAIARSLMDLVGPALRRPGVADACEDYVVFQIESGVPGPPEPWADAHPGAIARVLRAEPGALSGSEVTEAMRARMSYAPSDLLIADWNGAVLIDPRPDETLKVIEFAVIELLEMRHLDDRLDIALDALVGQAASPASLARILPRTSRRMLARLTALLADGQALYEGVNNALKLMGDPFLARLSRLCTSRLGVEAWEANVRRKLDLLESLHAKVSEHESNVRVEALEWIIILLIGFEVVMAFVRG